jgi:hypothetical protein
MTTEKKIRKLVLNELDMLNNNTIKLQEILNKPKNLNHQQTNNFIYDSTNIINGLQHLNEKINMIIENYNNNFSDNTSQQIYNFEEKYKKAFLIYALLSGNK